MHSILYRMHFPLEPRVRVILHSSNLEQDSFWTWKAEYIAKDGHSSINSTNGSHTSAPTGARVCAVSIAPVDHCQFIYFFFFSLWKLSVGICATSFLATWAKLSLIWEERTSTEKSTQPDWLEGMSEGSFSWAHSHRRTQPTGMLSRWSRAGNER